MKLYFGNQFVKKAEDKLSSKEVILKTKNILLATTKPYYKISLSQGNYIFIWGDIYAVKRSNGTYDSVDMVTEKKHVLKELFESLGVVEASKVIEGNYIGVFIGRDNNATVFGDSFNRTEVFYILEGNEGVVSTDLEATLKGVKKIKYSQEALANLLTAYGYYAPKKHTIYEDVRRLGVGESLMFKEGKIKVEQVPFVSQSTRPFGNREHHEYANILEDAVKNRGSDSCNWVFLSSGWDSTSLLAILVKKYGTSKVHAVIGEMIYSDRAGTINQFELERAKKVADYYGVQLDVVPLNLCGEDSVEYWKNLRDLLKKQHIYAIASYNYSRLSDYVSKYAGPQDAIFAGEISDGAHNFGFSQFATILEHPDLGFREYSDKMNSYLFGPSFFKRVLDNNYQDDAVYKLLRGRVGSDAFDDEQSLDEEARRLKYFISFFFRNVRIPFYGLYNTKMLTQDGAKQYENKFSKIYLGKIAAEATPETLYSCLLYLYNSFHWQGSTVRMLSVQLEENGQRLKLPFGDGRMQDFLSEMPENWGRGLELKPTKYPLKWMLENCIDYPLHLQTGPHSYLYDVNPQFSHSSEILFGSYLSNYLKELLKNYPYEAILQEDFFDLQYMRKLVDDYRNGVELTGVKRNDLMSLATLCLTGWY